MGIFDLFKNKADKESAAQAELDKANEHFANGAYQEALSTLSWGFRKDVDLIPLYDLAAKCLEKLEAVEEANLFRKVLQKPRKFNSYKSLGTHFYEVGHYDLALPFLEKAVSIDPSQGDTVHDLSIVYARRFQIEKAIETLEKSNPENDFWNYWFWCKLKVLAGQTEGIKKELDGMMGVLNQAPNQEEVAIPKQKVEEVLEMLIRHEQVTDPGMHIHNWHFIQYGAIILDFFEDEEDYVAGGRYVASWGSNESVKQIIHRLKTYTQSLELGFDKVMYLTGRDSEIVGRVAGHELDLPASPYQSGISTETTLVVGANSHDFNPYPEFSEVKNGELLFALNHDWLHAAAINPDISGLMTQAYYFPWNGGGLRIVDREKGITERTEMDSREAEAIAREIFSQQVTPDLDEEKLNFYIKNKAFLKAIGSKANKFRFNFMVESPVPGSYFG